MMNLNKRCAVIEMVLLYMKIIRVGVLYMALPTILLIGCSEAFNASSIDADQLCSQASIAFEKKRLCWSANGFGKAVWYRKRQNESYGTRYIHSDTRAFR